MALSQPLVAEEVLDAYPSGGTSACSMSAAAKGVSRRSARAPR
jgi:hypothetical protein